MVLRYFGVASEDGSDSTGGMMRTAILLALAVPFLVAGAGALCSLPSTPPGAVRVRLDDVPPDACLELFGPGPCRPRGGMPTSGWTDAVAGPAPEGWRGK